ncbi:hypothetical protein WDZ11_22355 (plasmid) [Roseomonas mucosa]|uniref:hypothetical protein n=1 Tax=Roseomonas mucosa TaxID=207340 RepID=UPI0030D0F774
MDPSIKAIRKAASSKPPIRHSAVYLWLRQRHDELADIIREHGPGWELIRSKMAKQGLTNKNGKPLTVSSVRQTWAIVCRHIREGKGFPSSGKAARKPPNRSPRDSRAPVPVGNVAAANTPVAAMEKGPMPFAPNLPNLRRPEPKRPTPEEAMEIAREQLDPDYRANLRRTS